MSGSIDKMTVKWKKGSFSDGMKFTVSWLKRIEKLIPSEAISYARLDNTPSDFGYNGKIGNWPVFWKVFLRRALLLTDRDELIVAVNGTTVYEPVDYTFCSINPLKNPVPQIVTLYTYLT